MFQQSIRRLAAPVVLTALLVGIAPNAQAQENGRKDETVSREEFAKFLEEYRKFQSEFAQLKDENARLSRLLADMQRPAEAVQPQSQSQREEWQSELETALATERERILDQVRLEFNDPIEWLSPGLSNFTLGGFATLGYQDRQNLDSTFNAGIAPILLWKPSDELLFEAEIHLALGEEETHVDLGYAHASYIVNDYLTIGGGKFLLPFGVFNERIHPSWINKLPTSPLTASLVGESGLGVQVRGGFSVGESKLNYSAYYINGPDFAEGQSDAGRLGFARNADNNNGKTYGARVGFLPIPELELGYSFLSGRVGDSGGIHRKIDTLMQGIDFAYAREFESLGGRLDLRGEFVWADTDDAIFVGPFNPFTFDNKSNGWYIQAAYRPTLSDAVIGEKMELKNLEFVVRYDQLRRPGPKVLGVDRDQLTFGFNYWIKPNVVFKTAYVFDDAHGGKDRDGIFLQFAIGF